MPISVEYTQECYHTRDFGQHFRPATPPGGDAPSPLILQNMPLVPPGITTAVSIADNRSLCCLIPPRDGSGADASKAHEGNTSLGFSNFSAQKVRSSIWSSPYSVRWRVHNPFIPASRLQPRHEQSGTF